MIINWNNNAKLNYSELIFSLIFILVYIVPSPNLSISPYVYILILLASLYNGKFSNNQLIILINLPIFFVVGYIGNSLSESLNAFITLLIVSIINIQKIVIGRRFLGYALSIAIVVSLLYLVVDNELVRISTTGRYHLSNLDPNFSGIGLLFIVALSAVYKFRVISLAAIILSFIVLSRAALISILIFYTFLYFNVIYTTLKKNISFVWLIILSNMILYFFSEIVMVVNFSSLPINYESRPDRIFNLFDESNYGRLMGFMQFYQYFFNGNFLYVGDLSLHYRSGVPHNSLMQILSSLGVLVSVVYLVMLKKITKYQYNKAQVALTIAYIFYSLFLHGLFMGYYFLMYILIMRIINDNLFDICNE